MFRFLTDEDFDGDILDGLVRRMPDLDIVRAQDVGLAGQEDPVILAWAGAWFVPALFLGVAGGGGLLGAPADRIATAFSSGG